MKILYHHKRDNLKRSSINDFDDSSEKYLVFGSKYDSNDAQLRFSDGFVLYEVAPQNRFFRINNVEGIINLPYLYFGLRYYVGVDGRLIYPGIYQSGLQLYFGTGPIKTFDDVVYTMPTDPSGYVCINHRLDYTQYDSIEALSSRIIGSWYGYQHHGGIEVYNSSRGYDVIGFPSKFSTCGCRGKDYECKICYPGKYKVNWVHIASQTLGRRMRDILTSDKRHVVIPEEARISRD